MPNTIPVSLASLIGREQEIETLCQLLYRPDVRLVTITGPGGVGKTSLALQVAHGLQDAFADGVFFVSLAAISDSTLVIPTIAHALGVIESPNRLLLDSLKEFLRDRQAIFSQVSLQDKLEIIRRYRVRYLLLREDESSSINDLLSLRPSLVLQVMRVGSYSLYSVRPQ